MVQRVKLEAATMCQLRCPLCPTGMRWPGLGWGYLRLRDFKRMVESVPSLRSVELSNWGEMFLNPDLIPIMVYAQEQGIQLTADNGVNFNRCDDETLEALVRCRFSSMRIALDGASQDTYAQYRYGGDFERVIRHIRRLNQFKEQYGSDRPRLTWQFVIFGHNEHELPAARQMAGTLGMDFVVRLSWDATWSPVKDPAWVAREVGLQGGSREDVRAATGEYYFQPCHELWDQPVINFNGALLGCCVNFGFGDFGNVFDYGLLNVMRGERYQYAQAMVTGQAPERADIPCVKCSIYRAMQRDKRWIRRQPVMP